MCDSSVGLRITVLTRNWLGGRSRSQWEREISRTFGTNGDQGSLTNAVRKEDARDNWVWGFSPYSPCLCSCSRFLVSLNKDANGPALALAATITSGFGLSRFNLADLHPAILSSVKQFRWGFGVEILLITGWLISFAFVLFEMTIHRQGQRPVLSFTIHVSASTISLPAQYAICNTHNWQTPWSRLTKRVLGSLPPLLPMYQQGCPGYDETCTKD